VLLCLVPAFFIAGAIFFAFLIGLLMHLIYRKEDNARLTDARLFDPGSPRPQRSLGQEGVFLLSMIGVLVAGFLLGRRLALASLDSGDRGRAGLEKDRNLHGSGGGDVHRCGSAVRVGALKPPGMYG
jgi:hypothetical protein